MAVLISIQPYYVFLIIARIMGWNIPQGKTIEVRKDFPKSPAWNKTVHIYCSKNKKSFNRIPAQYQPFIAKLLGKVVGEFVCDMIYSYSWEGLGYSFKQYKEACITAAELDKYGYKNGKYGLNRLLNLYGWHISELKIYGKPKELGAFKKAIACEEGEHCFGCTNGFLLPGGGCRLKAFTRPSQSWCYAELFCED